MKDVKPKKKKKEKVLWLFNIFFFVMLRLRMIARGLKNLMLVSWFITR